MAKPMRSDRWTGADLDHLPENGLHYEVLNGQLVVSAPPTTRHQVVLHGMAHALNAALPDDDYEIGYGLGVLIGQDEPIPDLIVTASPIDPDLSRVPAEQVVLAIEVVSESSRMADRSIKPLLYAEAGIPHYWRCEIQPVHPQLPGELPPVVFTYVLGTDGSYQLTHRVSAGDTVTLRIPFEFCVDPAALLSV
ncbi:MULTISPECIES: Uma2 family endonuclease [Nocardia]|uniref:Uma2 family endonuclease n=1 Tax=Nocardia TaxID=1817 RepID=UPI001CE3F5B5|nr:MULTISPECIES: Uma2 family endonuclease [Nocardia]